MDNKELSELLKYTSDKGILIVTYKGTIKDLQCPFRVKVIQNIGILKQGDMEVVESVKITIQIITVYIIRSKAYYYYHFDIVLE